MLNEDLQFEIEMQLEFGYPMNFELVSLEGSVGVTLVNRKNRLNYSELLESVSNLNLCQEISIA